MRIVYRALFHVRLRHAFYANGESHDDFVVEPSPATRRWLLDYGLVFRRQEDGWAVYGEVTPGADPPQLARPIGEDTLRFHFFLLSRHSHVAAISDLGSHRPARNVFYFNNLRDDQVGGRLHLGDSVANARVGAAVALVTRSTYSHRFAAPVAGATITLTDIFGNTLDTTSFVLPGATPEYRIELGEIDGLVPGRYLLSDDHGGSEALFYAPDAFGRRIFAVVELFNRTDRLTPENSEQVPAAYRYLDGDEITGIADYNIQIESRATTWRYNVIKKYSSNGITLGGLAVSGPIAFSKALDTDRAVFTSDTAVALGEAPRALSLEHNGSKIRDLSSPSLTTPLQQGASAGSFVSEMFVYV